jgi:maltooligosyltrehalose synthase
LGRTGNPHDRARSLAIRARIERMADRPEAVEEALAAFEALRAELGEVDEEVEEMLAEARRN